MAISNYITAPSPANFSDLQTAVNTITGDATLYISNSLTVTSSLPIPENITLKFRKGAVITVNDDVTLTIDGAIEAGIYQIFNCLGTGKLNGNPKIEYAVPQWWHDGTSYWTKAVQNAVDFTEKVFFPKYHSYYFDDSVQLNMDLNHILFGHGIDSILVSDCPKPIFKMVNNTGHPTATNTASFEDLSFQCKKAIQINEDIGSDPSENIQILRVKINRCFIRNINNDGLVAINLYEVFDSVISENYIEGFEIGIKMVACDINTVENNRIINFRQYAIQDLSRIHSVNNGQFGSQNLILHNDILHYTGPSEDTNGNPVGAFIKSNSLHIIIRDNFLENNETNIPLAFIDCSNVNLNNKNIPLVVDITGNRFSPGARYTYLINENFRSLHINDAPLALPIEFIPPSSFCENINILSIKSEIPARWEGRPKAMNIDNVLSFRQWSSFNTTHVVQKGHNGCMIINSEHVSDLNYNPTGTVKLKAGSFILKYGTPNLSYFDISQKLNYIAGEPNMLPKKLNIKLTTRNISSSITDNEDFYVKIIKGNRETGTEEWMGRGYYLTHNTSNNTYNNFNTYLISPTIDFDSVSDYHFLLVATAPTLSDAEIKSIILEPIIL